MSTVVLVVFVIPWLLGLLVPGLLLTAHLVKELGTWVASSLHLQRGHRAKLSHARG